MDAGDTVTSVSRARGTNEDPVGSFPATGKQVDVPTCEVWHFSDEGKLVSAEIYHDQMTFLAQLDHIEEPVAP